MKPKELQDIKRKSDFICDQSPQKEKMLKSTKTPVMLLQELAVKRSTIPEYDLIYAEQGTHENKFQYQVTLLNVSAIGIGRSKKEAKHQAASTALELLARKNIFHPDTEAEWGSANAELNQDTQSKAPLNYIPKLLDVCIENEKISPAEFIEISHVGPPHCREFTYECRINSITTRSTAGSKKHAKQLAAKDMLNRIINIIPQLQEETDQLMLCNSDDVIINRYNKFSNLELGKVNFNSKVIEYDLQLKNLMENYNISKESVLNILEDPPGLETLKKFLEPFDLTYELKTIQEAPVLVVMLNINSETPITVMEVGTDPEQVQNKAVEKTLEMLKVLIE